MAVPTTLPCSFRWTGPPGQQVELAGDFPDWNRPVRMAEVSSGLYACDLELEPGVYRYKFLVNGLAWLRDPAARLDKGEVFENNLVVVGGTAPPLLFAPDRRHVCLGEDGRAVFHLEVADRGCAPSHVWIQDDPKEPRRRVFAPLQVVASRGEWRLLRAEAQLGPGRPRARPLFGFSGAPEQCFQLPEPRTARARAPAWVDGAVFYDVVLDRWVRGQASPPLPTARSRRAPSTANTCYGGDLEGVRESLPYLAGLGASALLLSPVHPSPSPLRHDSTDLLAVDPVLGGELALTRLLDDAHGRGLRVAVDFAATHVHSAHPAYQDVLARRDRSRFAGWFRLDDDRRERDQERPWLQLAQGSPARRYALKAADRLACLGVDGLRLCDLEDAPADFWAELRARLRAKHPGLLLLGDVRGDNPARHAEERGVDAAMDFQHRQALVSFFARGADDAASFWQRTCFDRFRAGPFDASFFVTFLDHKDTPRFLSQAVLHDRLRLALTYLLLRPEPVCLQYGTELGLAGTAPGGDDDDVWPERLPMPAFDGPPNQTQALVATLSRMRRELEPLRTGTLRLVRAQYRMLVLDRSSPGLTVRAYLNAGSEAMPLADVPDSAQLLLTVNDPWARRDSALPGGAARLLTVPGPPSIPA